MSKPKKLTPAQETALAQIATGDLRGVYPATYAILAAKGLVTGRTRTRIVVVSAEMTDAGREYIAARTT